MKEKKRYNSDVAYHVSVKPLGIILSVIGVILILIFVLAKDTSIYFNLIESKIVRRYIVAAMGIIYIGIGAGLLLKKIFAWYLMFCLLFVSYIFTIIDVAISQSSNALFSIIIMSIFLLSIGIGLYFATKPVFSKKN